jgi:hypothetical protein
MKLAPWRWCGGICFVGERVAGEALPCFEVPTTHKAGGPQWFALQKKQGKLKRVAFLLCK